MKELHSTIFQQKHLHLRLDNTLNRPVHEKLLILSKSQVYLFYTEY